MGEVKGDMPLRASNSDQSSVIALAIIEIVEPRYLAAV
jgi:hypothetical protein